jgi:hypothetical protein
LAHQLHRHTQPCKRIGLHAPIRIHHHGDPWRPKRSAAVGLASMLRI